MIDSLIRLVRVGRTVGNSLPLSLLETVVIMGMVMGMGSGNSRY
jgi:hypothetical protein